MKKFNHKILLAMLFSVLQFALVSIVNADDNTSRLMFTTQELYDGNLGGVVGADAKCSQDVNCVSGSCQAVIALPHVRQPYVKKSKRNIQDAVNWVLLPSQKYINLKGDTIGTTNVNGVFEFKLGNAVNPEDNDKNSEAWTGFYKDWTVAYYDPSYGANYSNNCYGWIDNSSVHGYAAYVSSQSSSMISKEHQSCKGSHYLYCVDNNTPITEPTNVE